MEQVTSAEASRRKRGLGRKFKDAFIGGDARSTADYVVIDVIIPAVRDLLFDSLEAGIQRMIYGESRRRRPTPGPNPVGHVDYRGMSSGPMTTRTSSAPRMVSRRSRARHDFEELIIPTRQEAEEVIDRMFDILSRYGSVSVAHLYELTGIQSQHTDMKWGWRELRGSKAVRLRQGGFLLDLPEPEPLG